jgi:uncharacterized ferredoxin-like protein
MKGAKLMEIIKTVAELMALSARTAPKGAGQDYVETVILSGADLQLLAQEMANYGTASGKLNFDRDGQNVAASGAVLLISIKEPKKLGLNCGACGQTECALLPTANEGPEFSGPVCAWRLVDLGIALGSAVKTAGLLNVDNRIMYRVGVVARKLGLIKGDVVIGVPLSSTGKNPYFDR